MYYSGGIYSSVAHGQRAEWEPVDHAVLLVGYGSEDGRDPATTTGTGGRWGGRCTARAPGGKRLFSLIRWIRGSSSVKTPQKHLQKTLKDH